jgi:hypothetical protein
MAALLLQQTLREVEVGVRVIALAKLFDRQAENLWI